MTGFKPIYLSIPTPNTDISDSVQDFASKLRNEILLEKKKSCCLRKEIENEKSRARELENLLRFMLTANGCKSESNEGAHCKQLDIRNLARRNMRKRSSSYNSESNKGINQ